MGVGLTRVEMLFSLFFSLAFGFALVLPFFRERERETLRSSTHLLIFNVNCNHSDGCTASYQSLCFPLTVPSSGNSLSDPQFLGSSFGKSISVFNPKIGFLTWVFRYWAGKSQIVEEFLIWVISRLGFAHGFLVLGPFCFQWYMFMIRWVTYGCRFLWNLFLQMWFFLELVYEFLLQFCKGG